MALQASEQELFQLLKLMADLGISLRTSDDGNQSYLVSSFDKNLLPFLMELQPKVEKPAFDAKTNYYLEFWKVFVSNEILISSLKEISMEKVLMEQKIREYERIYQELEQQIKPTKKKRRKAKDITKNFVCPYPTCKKKYGSNVSLNLHIKRSHNGGNKSEREKYAKMVFEALKEKTVFPTTTMTLYPSFMNDVENEFLRIKATNFKEEFHPSRLFSYTMDGIDHVMDDEDEEDVDISDDEAEEEVTEEEEESQADKIKKENVEVIIPERKISKKISNGQMHEGDESLSGVSFSIQGIVQARSPLKQNSEDKEGSSYESSSIHSAEQLKKRIHHHHHHHHHPHHDHSNVHPNTFHRTKLQKKTKKT